MRDEREPTFAGLLPKRPCWLVSGQAEAKSFIRVPWMGTGTHTPGPSPTVFPDVLAGNEIRSRIARLELVPCELLALQAVV